MRFSLFYMGLHSRNTLLHLNGYDWPFLLSIHCRIEIANTSPCDIIRNLMIIRNLKTNFSTNTTVDMNCKVKRINTTHSRQPPNRCLLGTDTDREGRKVVSEPCKVSKLMHYGVELKGCVQFKVNGIFMFSSPCACIALPLLYIY